MSETSNKSNFSSENESSQFQVPFDPANAVKRTSHMSDISNKSNICSATESSQFEDSFDPPNAVKRTSLMPETSNKSNICSASESSQFENPFDTTNPIKRTYLSPSVLIMSAKHKSTSEITFCHVGTSNKVANEFIQSSISPPLAANMNKDKHGIVHGIADNLVLPYWSISDCKKVHIAVGQSASPAIPSKVYLQHYNTRFQAVANCNSVNYLELFTAAQSDQMHSSHTIQSAQDPCYITLQTVSGEEHDSYRGNTNKSHGYNQTDIAEYVKVQKIPSIEADTTQFQQVGIDSADIYSDEDLVKSTKQFSAFNRENPNRANVKLEEKVKDLTENLDSAYALTGQPVCSSTSNMINHTGKKEDQNIQTGHGTYDNSQLKSITVSALSVLESKCPIALSNSANSGVQSQSSFKDRYISGENSVCNAMNPINYSSKGVVLSPEHLMKDHSVQKARHSSGESGLFHSLKTNLKFNNYGRLYANAIVPVKAPKSFFEFEKCPRH
jgi:hypothetical protein